ncbi:hypothetical protein HP456_14410 [Bacillus haikouensis]|jgi:hypothetical protein|uniref:hypothetical protein n=1 Tax=Bacillus haikouensis TaxID=1510468 RepID=UPI001552060A|nr:hypothetical protein [Bacillus haikouensis]NQD67105.1 hypothetical protein [Bacillus haikouensis]
MNGYLMEILAREIVQSLPQQKKDMYRYVVRREDELARQASTSDEFMSLLIQHAPHQQAADHFHLSFGKFMTEMREIEKEIDRQLEQKLKQAKWIDCSDIMGSDKSDSLDVLYFYFTAGTGSVRR